MRGKFGIGISVMATEPGPGVAVTNGSSNGVFIVVLGTGIGAHDGKSGALVVDRDVVKRGDARDQITKGYAIVISADLDVNAPADGSILYVFERASNGKGPGW